MEEAALQFTPPELAAIKQGLLKAYANLYRLHAAEKPETQPYPGFSVCGTLEMRHDFHTELFYADLLTRLLNRTSDPFTRVHAMMMNERCYLVMHNDYSRTELPTPAAFAEILDGFDFNQTITRGPFGDSLAYSILADAEKRAGLMEPFAPKQYRPQVVDAATRAEKAWGVRPRFA